MSNESTEYRFVGGSHNGQIWHVRGELPAGREIQMPAEAAGGKFEIYRLDDEHKFHFSRYAVGLNPGLKSPQAMNELGPLFARLEDILEEFDSVVDRHGGPSSGTYTVGNWVIHHRDA